VGKSDLINEANQKLTRKGNCMPKMGEEEKGEVRVSATIEELLLGALARGEEILKTGRYIMTFRENSVDQGIKSLDAKGFNIKDARDFKNQAVTLQDVGNAEALVFPEIRSALVSSPVVQEFGISIQGKMMAEGPRARFHRRTLPNSSPKTMISSSRKMGLCSSAMKTRVPESS
jgi:hypothetical protein